MKAPISWLREYVDIDMPIEELAKRITLAGLEVEEIRYVGLPLPVGETRPETKISGFGWEPDKIVVAAIHEVMPHPNADRLVLCKLDDGEQEHIVLTGAPNLFKYRGIGPLNKPLKVAYAREGATIIDAYNPGNKPTKLKRKKIRGVESFSMACSERELGISDEHEGIIILDADAPTGMPLVNYMGDAVFDIAITPNIARDANIIGIAREIAALTGKQLKTTDDTSTALSAGRRRTTDEEAAVGGRWSAVAGFASIEITDPTINPRFALGLIENVAITPSPYKVQVRLKLAGVRPINAIVDATNYAMLEVGEPLHAFDYDVLLKRAKAAGQDLPTIITRTAQPGEKLVTLDKVERTLDDFTVLVCDQSGPLALAGVMGGLESEVTASTTRVLLEGAAWNMINTRRTVMAQNLPSEASYRFSRGVHPELAVQGIQRGLELMHQWSGGPSTRSGRATIVPGLVDNYPLPPEAPSVEITPADVRRWLGIKLSAAEIVDILESLGFECQLGIRNQESGTKPQAPISNLSRSIPDRGQSLITVKTPHHRLDISTGIVGVADLMEEIARIYGYDRIPGTRMADELPPQKGNPGLEIEEGLRDLLVNLGLQEVITHRLTSPEREARILPKTWQVSNLQQDQPVGKQDLPGLEPYFKLANPVSSDRAVLRHSLLASVLEIVERNAHIRERIAIFEISPVFLSSEDSDLPGEPKRLVIALTGPRALPDWGGADTSPMDFFDLKGVVDAALRGLHLTDVSYEPAAHPSFHPGKCARVLVGKRQVGVMGELHPQVRENYDLPETPLLAAEFNVDAIITSVSPLFDVASIPSQPPMLEDIAIIVDETLPAAQIEAMIRQTGGKVLTGVRLFDVYRSDQIGAGKKSLAYSLTYQSPDRTLTDKDAAKLRNKIVRRLEREFGAQLRG